MIDEAKLQNWVGGANNRQPRDRLPEGFVRDLVNLHPIGGQLKLRPQADVVVPCTRLRYARAFGLSTYLVDEDILYSIGGGYSKDPIAAVPPTGDCAMADMDGVIYGSVADATFRIVNGAVVSWGLPTPIGVVGGAGDRKVACTFTDASGLESGASPVVECGDQVTVPAPPQGCVTNIFASAVDGGAMHYQFNVSAAGTYTLPTTNEGGRELGTQHITAPPPASLLATYESRVFGASGNVLYATLPLQPNHVDLMEGYVFFPEPIVALAAGNGGVYVGADKLYRLEYRNGTVEQQTLSEYPPLEGGLCEMEDGSVVAFTRNGVVAEQADNRGNYVMVPLTEANYDVASHSSAVLGEVDYDGVKLVVASVTDKQERGSGLSARDFFEAEVTRP